MAEDDFLDHLLRGCFYSFLIILAVFWFGFMLLAFIVNWGF